MPQQMQADDERRKAIQDLITLHGIKKRPNTELPFKDLMQIKSQQPNFYIDWKKNRTKLLRAKEPAVPEPFLKVYRKKQKVEEAAEAKRKAREEARRLAEEEAEGPLRASASNANRASVTVTRADVPDERRHPLSDAQPPSHGGSQRGMSIGLEGGGGHGTVPLLSPLSSQGRLEQS